MSSPAGSRRIPAAIPDIDQGQFLPLGDDDEYTFGVRDSDGNLVIQRDGVANDLIIDANLAVTIPGDLTVDGATTTVDDIVTTDVFVEDSGGTDAIHLSGDTDPEFIKFLSDNGEIRHNDDAGAATLADMAVSGTPAAATEESLALAVDGTAILKAYAEADGAGGIQNQEVRALQPLNMAGNAIDGDDAFEIIFGTGDDMDVTYVSGNDALEWSDRGTSTRMQLDRTTGNLNIEGSLTEGAAL